MLTRSFSASCTDAKGPEGRTSTEAEHIGQWGVKGVFCVWIGPIGFVTKCPFLTRWGYNRSVGGLWIMIFIIIIQPMMYLYFLLILSQEQKNKFITQLEVKHQTDKERKMWSCIELHCVCRECSKHHEYRVLQSNCYTSEYTLSWISIILVQLQHKLKIISFIKVILLKRLCFIALNCMLCGLIVSVRCRNIYSHWLIKSL